MVSPPALLDGSGCEQTCRAHCPFGARSEDRRAGSRSCWSAPRLEKMLYLETKKTLKERKLVLNRLLASWQVFTLVINQKEKSDLNGKFPIQSRPSIHNKDKPLSQLHPAVLWIRKYFFRNRICGSVNLIYGSGSGMPIIYRS